jgi:hypothetical protein
MRGRRDLERIYRQALRAMPQTMDGHPPRALPESWLATLDDWLSDAPQRGYAVAATPSGG